MLPLTQNSLLVFGLAGDDSLGSAELSLKSARECARGGWPIGVVGRHNGQHAAEGGNERALHCVNTQFLQSLSQHNVCFRLTMSTRPQPGVT